MKKQISLVKEWIDKAEEDFRAIEILSQEKTKQPCDTICFHAQQTVEKYLKAFLVFHKRRFFKTHDLIQLRDLALKQDRVLNQLDPELHLLNLYSIDVRYPGKSATLQESQGALVAATKVRKYLRRSLGLA